MKRTAFPAFALAVAVALSLTITPAFADENKPENLPFSIVRADGTPAECGKDYLIDGTSLIVTGQADSAVHFQGYTIAMAEGVEQTDWNIIVQGGTPFVTLQGVSIKTDNRFGALAHVGATGTCDVYFSGANHLECSRGAGVYVDSGGSLKLFGASEDGTDSLVAVGGDECPGIGAVDTKIRPDDGSAGDDAPLTCKGIDIYDLVVDASGGKHGAGIGCGASEESSLVGSILIKDSTVKAAGGEHGAGIGSGWARVSSEVDDIRIYSSDVVASGEGDAAGIGSGAASTGNSEVRGIEIQDSVVTVMGGYHGAGVGSGYAIRGESNASNITIASGTVRASSSATGGSSNAPGIGSGCGLSSVADGISILGGEVHVVPSGDELVYGSAGIGSSEAVAWPNSPVGKDSVSIARNIKIAGGTVTVDWKSAHAPAIGSGLAASKGGRSEARNISISDGDVTAHGWNGAIGSGTGKMQSLFDGACISGGTVEATAMNNEYAFPAIGSGWATIAAGTSTTSNLRIEGGDVTATAAGASPAFGPAQPPDPEDPESNYTTSFADSLVAPQAGFQASMWAGDSDATAELLLDGEKAPFDLTALDAPYATIMFSEAVYDVWVSGVQVTPSNAGDVLGDGTVRFSPTVEEGMLPDTGKKHVGTLTLNGAKLQGVEGENHGAGIYAQGGLVVVLAEGSENDVEGAFGGEDSDSDAVSVSQALAIAGSGSLDAQAAHVEGDGSSVGISCEASFNMEEGTAHGGYLLITDAARVHATGGSAELAAEQCASMGAAAFGELVVEKDAVLAAQAGAAATGTSSMGAFGTRAILRDNARIEAVGGKGDVSVGIGSTDFQIMGGTLVAQSDPAAALRHDAVIGAMDLSSYADYSWRAAPDGAYAHLGFVQPEQTDYLEIASGNLAGGPSTDNAGGTPAKALVATGDAAIPIAATLGTLAILAGAMLAISHRRQRCAVSEAKRGLDHE